MRFIAQNADIYGPRLRHNHNTRNMISLELAETRQSFTNELKYCVKKYNIQDDSYYKPIGFITLRVTEHPFITTYHGNVEYEVYTGHKGAGVAGKALQALKVHAIEAGVYNLWMTIIPTNYASVRVCEKAGAKFCGTIVKGKLIRLRYKLEI